MIRMAFFGSSLVSAYWNGAATYYRGLLRELARHGFDITFFEPDAFDRQAHRDIEPPEWAHVVVYPATRDGLECALDQARNADVLVKASGVGVFDDELDVAIPALRRPGALAILWDVDAPATLAAMAVDPGKPLRSAVADYDLVLTYGGGDPVVANYRAVGARACVPIYNALEPDSHHPVASDPTFACDLAFIGNRLPDREARVEEFFLRPAAALPERSFVLGGNGWHDKAMTDNVRRLGHVYTHQHNAINCSARAVLNVNRESMAENGFSPPTRVFEVAGAGACLITDAWAGIELFLDPGEEVLVAADGDAVAAHLASLTEERARAIGTAARRRILARHTYAHRAREVVRLLGGRRVTLRAAS